MFSQKQNHYAFATLLVLLILTLTACEENPQSRAGGNKYLKPLWRFSLARLGPFGSFLTMGR